MRDRSDTVPVSIRVSLVVVALLVPRVASADAVMVTRAMKAGTIMEVFVEEDAIEVQIEIDGRGLAGFDSIARAAVEAEKLPTPIPPTSKLSFLADGVRLRGVVERAERRKRVERDEVTGKPSPTPGAEEVLFVVLRYALPGLPQTLVISPPTRDGYAAADIGFVVYHRGIAVNDFRYLATPESLALDWEDPFYSRFERRTLKRSFDAPVNVFLYVEPFEVRKEIVARPLDLARFTELDVRAHEPIPASQRDVLLAQISKFLAARAPVTIDGTEVTPILDRIHFLKRGLRMTRVVTSDEPIDGTNAMVGAIFVYPVDGTPKDVRLEWDLFDARVMRVPGTATDEAGSMPYFLTPDDSELHWVNYLKRSALPGELQVQPPKSRLPIRIGSVVGLLLALGLLLAALKRRSWGLGASAVALAIAGWWVPTPSVDVAVPSSVRAPSGSEATPTIHALLYNIYRALDFRGEDVVFDRLAQSLSGEVLERVYLEMRRGLRLENQGGARVRVREVDMLEVVPVRAEAEDTLRYRARWNATGSVGHWGHTHMRTNQYDAEIVLALIAGGWKIADIEVVEERRIDAVPSRAN